MVLDDPALIGQTREVWLLADDEVDQFAKGAVDRDAGRERTGGSTTSSSACSTSSRPRAGSRLRFNRIFFTHGDSREPELAGICGALWARPT